MVRSVSGSAATLPAQPDWQMWGVRWVLDQIVDEEVSSPAHQPAEVLSALTRLVRAAQLDGLYVALAEEQGCALVTTDRRLSGAKAPCEVHAPAAS